MPQLVPQSARSADNSIGIQGVLVVAAVIAVVAGSLTLASRLDPLLRKFAPDPDAREGRPAVASVQPVQAVQAGAPEPVRSPVAPDPTPAVAEPPAPQEAAASPPDTPPPAREQSPQTRNAASLPATLPTAARPRPRPSASAEAQPAPRQRESRRQVARNVRNARRERYDQADADISPSPTSGFGSRALVVEARRYLGTNPTRMARLWCARFMNFVLDRAGYRGTGSDAALSFARYGHRVSGPRIGAIAVMRRKGGGHVGIVTGIDRHGNPILVSGNTPNARGRSVVAERVYPRRRIIAYVMPRR